MADEPKQGDVTTQPSISTEEAEATDIELSPVGDEKVDVTEATREEASDQEARSLFVPSEDIEVRDLAKREVDMRLLPWGHTIETVLGPEEFRQGAFDGIDPSSVYLYGAEHEMRFGMGQTGQMQPVRVPVGRATRVTNEADGPHATFKIARTGAGDENLALMADRIISGVSVEFRQVPGGTVIEKRDGRRVRVHQRALLTGATPTHRPAYGEQAAVLAVRSHEERTGPVTEIQEVPAAGADFSKFEAAFAQIEARAKAQEEVNARLLERLEREDEQARADIVIPAATPKDKLPHVGEWLQMVVRMMSGERIPEAQMRTLDDVITSDNAGVVPPAYLTELIGVIDNSRPFLSTTRRLPTPDSGMKLTVPVINQRPTVAVQNTEKAEVDSTKTLIGTTDFNAITIAGAGDLSIQIIKRSSPNFLNLWIELLAEAYAIESEDQAILALLNATGGVGAATALDPENLSLGAAYVAAFDAIRRPPDTIWLSTEAVGAFIDAKATTSNQPLYPGLRASATAAGGVEGVISGLRPVHVPSLDAHGAYAIVGPSSGFAWAEDGTYTLQVDVPAKAGRDVALVGILWPAPWYPAAFTTYNVAS